MMIHLNNALQDNPGIIFLGASALVALTFVGLVVMPTYYRRYRRRMRQVRRKVRPMADRGDVYNSQEISRLTAR
jgi:hypothetical protein